MNCKNWHDCYDYEDDKEAIVITRAHLRTLAIHIEYAGCTYCVIDSFECNQHQSKQACIDKIIDYAILDPTEE
jgi:hypothetical protein